MCLEAFKVHRWRTLTSADIAQLGFTQGGGTACRDKVLFRKLMRDEISHALTTKLKKETKIFFKDDKKGSVQ